MHKEWEGGIKWGVEGGGDSEKFSTLARPSYAKQFKKRQFMGVMPQGQHRAARNSAQERGKCQTFRKGSWQTFRKG